MVARKVKSMCLASVDLEFTIMIGVWVLDFSFLHSRCRRQSKSTAEIQVPHSEEVEYDADTFDRKEGRRRECWLVPLLLCTGMWMDYT